MLLCRDINNLATNCFAGSQDASCPTPLAPAPIACTSNADCPPAYPDCQQRSGGAFGPAGGAAHTITETGSPGGCLASGSQPVTLVGGFCTAPTFNSTIDAAADLPGPGAVSVQGVLQLQP